MEMDTDASPLSTAATKDEGNGINNIFVSSQYLTSDERGDCDGREDNDEDEWCGTIKLTPSDFVVEEISLSGRVASLEDFDFEDIGKKDIDNDKDKDNGECQDHYLPARKKLRREVLGEGKPVNVVDARAYLLTHAEAEGTGKEKECGLVWAALQRLHKRAQESVFGLGSGDSDGTSMSAIDNDISSNDNNKKDDDESTEPKTNKTNLFIKEFVDVVVVGTTVEGRTGFHAAMRDIFPFFKSDTTSLKAKEEDENKNTDDKMKKNSREKGKGKGKSDSVETNETATTPNNATNPSPSCRHRIRFAIDDLFFFLAPHLLNARTDLEALYRFRHRALGGCSSSKRTQSPSDSDSAIPQNVLLGLRPSSDTREIRRSLHHDIGQKWRGVMTSTVTVPVSLLKNNNNDDGKAKAKALEIRLRDRGRGRGRGCGPNPKQQAQTQWWKFVMERTDVEHFTSLRHLCQVMRKHSGRNCARGRGLDDLRTAGIKDRRAIVRQYVTIRGYGCYDPDPKQPPPPPRGLPLGSVLRVGNGTVALSRRAVPVKTPLDPGDHSGNRFRIVVRDLSTVSSTSSSSSSLTPTPMQNWEQRAEAVRRYGFLNYYGEQRVGSLTSALTDVPPWKIGRLLLRGEAQAAVNLLLLSSSSSSNSNILLLQKHLARFPDRPDECLRRMPQHGLWVSSYQSKVWNDAATERIRLHGLQTVPGDLILVHADTGAEVDNTTNDDGTSYKNKNKKKIVKVVGEDDLFHTKESKIPFSQIVLPLPGSGVLYPATVPTAYRDFPPTPSDNNKMLCFPKGAYRPLVASVRDLVVSQKEEDEVNQNNNVLAVTVTLDPGCYATMLLRELMRTRCNPRAVRGN